MKRKIPVIGLALAAALLAGAAGAYAQSAFKIPIAFKIAGKSYPAGDYLVVMKEDGKPALRQEVKNLEVLIPVKERIAQPVPPLDAAQLVFDEVGNFELSYTEYNTEYLLSEVWLPGADGYLVLAMKGAHKNTVVKAQAAQK